MRGLVVCGIAGWAGPGDPEDLHRMLESLRHRGPDETGLWANQSAALGIARLSIIDVANGHQPVFSADKQIIAVLNGEIYNFQDLAATLRSRGVHLTSGSDAEVIPHLYEQYGTDFVHQLRGMFAIALWDSRRQRLILTRDRVGKKPLLFRRHNSRLTFASEARALLATGWRPSANLNALNHVLAFGYLPEGVGAFQELESIPPGHVAIWDGDQLAIHRYWSWEPQPALDPNDALPALREVLEDSVKIRMVSERPVGAFLSGGVDSSIVTALMVRNSAQTIKTFSIGFADQQFDEAPYAAKVAAYLGTDHTAVQLEPDPELVVNQLASTFDQPLADPSAIPTMLLSELARQGVVVALSGDGGDEAFGGYERYLAAPMMQRFNPVLTAIAPLTRLAAKRSRKRRLRKLTRLLEELRGRESLVDRYRAIMTVMPAEIRSSIWSLESLKEIDLATPETDFRRLWDLYHQFPDLWRMRYQDQRSYLPGDLLVKADIASMSASLEVRSPFLDHNVLQLAAALPSQEVIHRHKTKPLLRQLAGELLPNDLTQRRKQGFGVPVAEWIRGPLNEMVSDVLLSSQSRSRGWLNVDEVERLLQRHSLGEDLHKQIWALFVVELWAQEWVIT